MQKSILVNPFLGEWGSFFFPVHKVGDDAHIVP